MAPKVLRTFIYFFIYQILWTRSPSREGNKNGATVSTFGNKLKRTQKTKTIFQKYSQYVLQNAINQVNNNEDYDVDSIIQFHSVIVRGKKEFLNMFVLAK